MFQIKHSHNFQYYILTMKHLLIPLLTLVTSISISAQQKSFDAGIEGGPSAIILRGNAAIDSTHKPTAGFSFGLFLQYNFINRISLRTGIGYEIKGTGVELRAIRTDNMGNTIETKKINATLHLNYVSVPLLFRKYFGKKTNYFINGGPFFGYLTGISQSQSENYFAAPDIAYYKRIDAGITAGLGAVVQLKVVSISFELRNNLGLYNINAATSFYNDNTIRTNATGLLFSLSYPLWKKQLTGVLLKI